MHNKETNSSASVVFFPYILGVFHNHNPSNLDSSDQQIRLLWCDLNPIPDYESVDLPSEVDQRIQIHWIMHNALQNNGSHLCQI